MQRSNNCSLFLLIFSSLYSYVLSEIFPIEILLDDNLQTFYADNTLSDYGSLLWCKQFNVNNIECMNSLISSIPNILNNRKQHPQTLIDDYASSEKHMIFNSSIDTCTDNYHVKGRCLLLNSLTKYILNSHIPGDYVEAGVHIGDSAAAIGQVFQLYQSQKKLYLYDSFKGMPEASVEIDGSYAISLSPSEFQKNSYQNHNNNQEKEKEYNNLGWGYEASAENVMKRLLNLNINKENIIIHEGWFNETFYNNLKQPMNHISILMVDGDWYQSVLDTLNRFYDQIPIGGVIVIDDYGYWEGARKALGTFLRSRPDIDMPLFERYGPDILYWIKGLQNNRP